MSGGESRGISMVEIQDVPVREYIVGLYTEGPQCIYPGFSRIYPVLSTPTLFFLVGLLSTIGASDCTDNPAENTNFSNR